MRLNPKELVILNVLEIDAMHLSLISMGHRWTIGDARTASPGGGAGSVGCPRR